MTTQRTLGITEPLDFSPKQERELETIASEFGLVVVRLTPPSPSVVGVPVPISRDEWIEFVSRCDYVISGKQGLSAKITCGGGDGDCGDYGTEGIYSARPGTVISHPFVNVAWVDKKRLAENNITLLNAPGCNRDAVAEWVLGCAMTLFREMGKSWNKRNVEPRLARTRSLAGKSAAVLGKGAVGTRVGEVLMAMKMDVKYLERGGGRQSIYDVVRDVDLVVNCLSSKVENRNVLDADFFMQSMSPGCVFVSMTNPSIYDIDGLLNAILSGRLRGAAIDVGNTYPGDVEQANYKKFIDFLDIHPQFEDSLLVTPQVAHYSDSSQRTSFDMAIENIRYAASGRLDEIPDRVWR
jgi:phosphoglycerate dehydrogenase-like enzyme